MTKTYFQNAEQLPLIVEAPANARSLAALCEAATAQRDFLREGLKRVGALLFRGFEVENQEDFARFVRRFSGREFFNYAGGASPRTMLEKNVYNSTEYPPELALELHNELSYSAVYPRHLYFFCQTAPEHGGATTLGDSRRILRRICPEIVGLFKEKGVLYERNLPPRAGAGYSWREAFETDDRQKVEEICRKNGAEFEWRADDYLRLRQIRPATCKHSETGEEVWFNQAHGFHTSALDAETLEYFRAAGEKPRLNSYFGDGSPICGLMLERVRKVLRAETIPHEWRQGDVLVLDNVLTAHGRMPFAGKRKIILAMT